MKKMYLYSRYERLWHWFQMGFIFILMVTGLEVNGLYTLFGYQKAATLHTGVGVTWLISFFVFVFWLFTTGEWKQYIPTTRKMAEVIRYYAIGIFKGEPHPVPKQMDAKHNPLQRLSYLILAAALLPLMMITGFFYWKYNSWEAWGLSFLTLQGIAFVHLALAFAVMMFVIVHVYMTTTGHTISSHIKAMITGFEEVEDDFQSEFEKRARQWKEK